MCFRTFSTDWWVTDQHYVPCIVCPHSQLYIKQSLSAKRASATENQLQKPCMTSFLVFLPIFAYKTTENRCRGPTGSNQYVISVPCTCAHSQLYIKQSWVSDKGNVTCQQEVVLWLNMCDAHIRYCVFDRIRFLHHHSRSSQTLWIITWSQWDEPWGTRQLHAVAIGHASEFYSRLILWQNNLVPGTL